MCLVLNGDQRINAGTLEVFSMEEQGTKKISQNCTEEQQRFNFKGTVRSKVTFHVFRAQSISAALADSLKPLKKKETCLLV